MATGLVRDGGNPQIGSAEQPNKELLEYEKIIHIYEQVTAGTHPRLKLPAEAREKLRKQSISTADVREGNVARFREAKLPPKPPQAQDNNVDTYQVIEQSTSVPMQTTLSNGFSGNQGYGFSTTKSDALVKAEIQLQRHRLERILKDQLERTRAEAKGRAFDNDAVPDFDVSAVFSKALEDVCHVPLLDVQAASTAGSSFDENSYYSSHHNESVISGQDLTDDSRGKAGEGSFHTGDAVRQVEDEEEQENEYEPADPYEPQDELPSQDQTQIRSQGYHREVPYVLEDNQMRDAGDGLKRRNGSFRVEERRRYPYYDPSYHGQAPPQDYARQAMPEMQVGHNQITSPAAPRPARVSPLAYRIPAADAMGRRTEYREQQVDSGDTSPASTDHLANPRKRRRPADVEMVSARRVSGRQVPASTEPYIKPEPISPAPLVRTEIPAVPNLGRHRGPLMRPELPEVSDRKRQRAEGPEGTHDLRYYPRVPSGPDRHSGTYRYDRYVEESSPPRTLARPGSRAYPSPNELQDYRLPPPQGSQHDSPGFGVPDQPARGRQRYAAARYANEGFAPGPPPSYSYDEASVPRAGQTSPMFVDTYERPVAEIPVRHSSVAMRPPPQSTSYSHAPRDAYYSIPQTSISNENLRRSAVPIQRDPHYVTYPRTSHGLYSERVPSRNEYVVREPKPPHQDDEILEPPRAVPRRREYLTHHQGYAAPRSQYEYAEELYDSPVERGLHVQSRGPDPYRYPRQYALPERSEHEGPPVADRNRMIYDTEMHAPPPPSRRAYSVRLEEPPPSAFPPHIPGQNRHAQRPVPSGRQSQQSEDHPSMGAEHMNLSRARPSQPHPPPSAPAAAAPALPVRFYHDARFEDGSEAY